jgi:hypothetical protein
MSQTVSARSITFTFSGFLLLPITRFHSDNFFLEGIPLLRKMQKNRKRGQMPSLKQETLPKIQKKCSNRGRMTKNSEIIQVIVQRTIIGIGLVLIFIETERMRIRIHRFCLNLFSLKVISTCQSLESFLQMIKQGVSEMQDELDSTTIAKTEISSSPNRNYFFYINTIL